MNPPFNSEGFKDEGKCDLCLKLGEKKTGRIVVYIDPMVRSFLKVTNICEWCRNRINSYVTSHFEQCWSSINYEALSLSLVTLLRSKLSIIANEEIYIKQMHTRYRGLEIQKYYELTN